MTQPGLEVPAEERGARGGRWRPELLSKATVKVTDGAVSLGGQEQRKTSEREGMGRRGSPPAEGDLGGVRVVQRGFSESWYTM